MSVLASVPTDAVHTMATAASTTIAGTARQSPVSTVMFIARRVRRHRFFLITSNAALLRSALHHLAPSRLDRASGPVPRRPAGRSAVDWREYRLLAQMPF